MVESAGGVTTHRNLSRRKKALVLLLTLLLVGLVTAGILEILTRIFMPQQESMRWLTPDDRYGHLMKPNFHQRYPFLGSEFTMDVQTNSLGFRDDEPTPPSHDTTTIVYLGDSYAFGHGVNIEDRFDTRLKLLLAASKRRYRHVNAGVNAWGTIQTTRYARDHFDVLDPDVIVLVFCSNDPTDDVYFLQKGRSFDRVRFPGKTFLRHHSHLFRLMTHRAFLLLYNFILNRQREEHPEAPVDTETATLTSDNMWDSTLTLIRGFHDDFIEYNPDGVILMVSSSPATEDIRDHLTSLDNGATLQYVDMYDRTAPMAPEEKRLPYDPHWNPMMHQIVAEYLAKALLDLENAHAE